MCKYLCISNAEILYDALFTLVKIPPSQASCSPFHGCCQWLQMHFQPMKTIKDIYKTLTFMLAYL